MCVYAQCRCQKYMSMCVCFEKSLGPENSVLYLIYLKECGEGEEKNKTKQKRNPQVRLLYKISIFQHCQFLKILKQANHAKIASLVPKTFWICLSLSKIPILLQHTQQQNVGKQKLYISYLRIYNIYILLSKMGFTCKVEVCTQIFWITSICSKPNSIILNWRKSYYAFSFSIDMSNFFFFFALNIPVKQKRLNFTFSLLNI